MSIIQSRKRADLAAVAVSGIAKAWTAYTPTITSGTGTLTTTSATGRSLVVGKLAFVQMRIVITTNGTGGGFISATLPNATPASYILAGRENALTGKMLECHAASVANIAIFFYDGTYPGADGAVLLISGCYETT